MKMLDKIAFSARFPAPKWMLSTLFAASVFLLSTKRQPADPERPAPFLKQIVNALLGERNRPAGVRHGSKY